MTDIFISYSRSDKPWVTKLANALEAEGYDVWWDPDLLPGQDYETVIREILDNVPCVITIWSKDSIQSHWVKAESNRGLERNVFIPVLCEEVSPPMPFERIQSANLQNWKGDTRNPDYQKIIRTLEVFCPKMDEPEQTSVPIENPPPAVPSPSADKSQLPWLPIGIFVALLAVAGVVASFLMDKSSTLNMVFQGSEKKADATVRAAENNDSESKNKESLIVEEQEDQGSVAEEQARIAAAEKQKREAEAVEEKTRIAESEKQETEAAEEKAKIAEAEQLKAKQELAAKKAEEKRLEEEAEAKAEKQRLAKKKAEEEEAKKLAAEKKAEQEAAAKREAKKKAEAERQKRIAAEDARKELLAREKIAAQLAQKKAADRQAALQAEQLKKEVARLAAQRKAQLAAAQKKQAELAAAKKKQASTGGQFIDHGNGTVTDSKTRLMWKKCSEGQKGASCNQGRAEAISWDDAMSKAKQSSFAGHSDWRLPTINELRTLVYCSNGVPQHEAWSSGCRGKSNNRGQYTRPIINQRFFPRTQDAGYWSSSPYTSGMRLPWLGRFDTEVDFAMNKYEIGFVRLVRSAR